jgi:hypothetical protein
MTNGRETVVQSHEVEIYDSIIKNLVNLIEEAKDTIEVQAIGSIVDNLSALRDSIRAPYHNANYALAGCQPSAVDSDGRATHWVPDMDFGSVPMVTNSLFTNRY